MCDDMGRVRGLEPISPLPNMDGRRTRSAQDAGAKKADDDLSAFKTNCMVSTLLSHSSSPASPGSSSPTAESAKDTSFLPPRRPKSTPFPYPERRDPNIYPLDEMDCDSDSHIDADSDSASTLFDSTCQPVPATGFSELPIEVHEAILDHIFGYRVSITSGSGMKVASMSRSWGDDMRQCRRKELTELALVSSSWRVLIQQRLYRHVKLKASLNCLEEAMFHFAQYQHLRAYVKHIEIWFPVFQPTYSPTAHANSLALPTVTTQGFANATYIIPGNNCTLDEVFRFVRDTFPIVRVLTLEGGERRKAPKVVHFHSQSHGPNSPQHLTVLPSVQTLVTRGQWNLMRDNSDFATILDAVPNLTKWNASYSKPKSKSYITISEFLPRLPRNISNLKLCLESDYRREPVIPAFYSKAALRTHVCTRLAATLPNLEHFSYTGRMCHCFFDLAARLVDPRNTSLKSIDLTVKNCCRPLSNFHDSGSGIQDMGFIEAFEKLVISAVRSLDKLKQLQYLRIRFVDLGKN
jgi:hypothetical protein